MSTAREKRIPVAIGLSLKKHVLISSGSSPSTQTLTCQTFLSFLFFLFRLGKSLGKKLQVSVVAVLNADGAHDKLTAVLEACHRLQALSAVQYKQQQQHMVKIFKFEALGLSLADRMIQAGGAAPLLSIRESSSEVSLSQLPPSKQLVLRVDTSPERVGSVSVIVKSLLEAAREADGASAGAVANATSTEIQHIAVSRVMEYPPYVIELRGGAVEAAKDAKLLSYRPWRPREGLYEITSTIYSEFNGRGDILASRKAMIRISAGEKVSSHPTALSTQAASKDSDTAAEEFDTASAEENSFEDDDLGGSVSFSDESDDPDHAAESGAPHSEANHTRPFGESSGNSIFPAIPTPSPLILAENHTDRRSGPVAEIARRPPRRGTQVDAEDTETLERLRAEKRRNNIAIPADDEDKPLPDHFESSLSELLLDATVVKALRSPSFFLASTTSSNQGATWTLFFKSPNESSRAVVLHDVSPHWNVQQLKDELSSKTKERPAKSMRIYFYSTLALREDVVLADVPLLCNFSTLLMLRKGQSASESLAML